MRFYQVEVDIKNNPFDSEDLKWERERELIVNIRNAIIDFTQESYDEKGVAYVFSKVPFRMAMGIIDDNLDNKDFARTLLGKIGLDYENMNIKEISLKIFFNSLSLANRLGLIEDDWTFSNFLGLDEFYHLWDESTYSDRIAEETKTGKELKKEAVDNFLGVQYMAELDRILKSKTQKKFVGHPAHYIIVSKNNNHRRVMIRNLISALYYKGRIPSKRYTLVRIDRNVSYSFLDRLYVINKGASVLLKIEANDIEDGNLKNFDVDIEGICQIIKEHCSKVLTFISIDSCSEKIKNRFKNALMGVSIVDISEDSYYKESAVKLITTLAKKDKLEISDDLKEKIANSEKAFDFNDIITMYNKWRHEYLGTQVFPEYKEYVTHETEQEKVIVSDSYKELQDMIGLGGAKKLIDNAINLFKLQKEYRVRGLKFNRPSMHMVFTGSPGTAKTSVARLFARILKDNGILSGGKLIEVGRADIVGKFVGHTAPKVKDLFERAKGSVLFIDEAYSLLEHWEGSYGDEAINAIVQEMENHREDVVVIFAGYNEEMKMFLQRNPGLSSRIAFHIPFDDYSSKELLDIAKLLAKQTGFFIEDDADAKLIKIFDDARKDKDFGNGRFARNLIEKAKFHQADRMMKKELEFVSDSEITCLKAEDFDFIEKEGQGKSSMGFAV